VGYNNNSLIHNTNHNKGYKIMFVKVLDETTGEEIETRQTKMSKKQRQRHAFTMKAEEAIVPKARNKTQRVTRVNHHQLMASSWDD
jgi:hypothetical protein